MNVGALTISLTARTAALMSSLSKVRTFENGVLASAQRINRSIGTVGQTLSVLSLPLIAIGGLAVKKFADFEYSMAKITGLAGVSSKQVQAWTKDVLYLSQKTGESAQDLADALYFIASSGIKNAAKTLEVLEMSAYGAMAGLGKAKDIANLLTSVINAYGEANVNTAHTMDVLVAAVREGKAEASDMAKSLGMVVNVASELGVSFENVASAVAATTRTGVAVSTSVTQLRQLLFSFVKERPMVESALETMGLTFQQVRKELSTDLLTGLIKLRAVTSAWGDAMAAQVIPNVRAFNEALSLTGVNVIETIKLFREVQNPTNSFVTAIASVADTARVKLNKAMQTMNNSLLVFGASIVDDVIPILNKFTELISKLFGWFSSLDDKTQNLIVTITAFSAVLGPMLLVVSSAVSTIGALVSSLVSVAVFLGPILAIFVALSAAAALVSDNLGFWEKAWPNIMIKIGKFTYKLQLGLLKLLDTIMLIGESFGPFMKVIDPLSFSLFNSIKGSKLAEAFSPEYRKQMIDEVAAEIKQMETDLATRPDLQYTFLDALTDSLKAEGNKLLSWVSNFAGDFMSKLNLSGGGGLKLNIGSPNFANQYFEYLSKFDAKSLEFQERVKMVEQAIEKYGSATAAFGNIAGLTNGMDLIKTTQLVNAQLVSINKEIQRLIGDNQIDQLQNLIEKLPAGLKGMMDPNTLGIINDYIETFNKSLKDANAKMEEMRRIQPFVEMSQAMDEAKNKLIASTLDLPTRSATGTLEQQKAYWESVREIQLDAVEKMRTAADLASPGSGKTLAIPQEVIDSWTEAGAKLDEINTKIELRNQLFQSIVSGAQALGTALGTALSGGEDGFKSFANAILQMAASVITALLGIALAANTIKWGFVAGLAIGLVGISAVSAAMSATKEKVDANLADGGIIPKGFPNDTFKANLSSDEAVIPLKKLPQLIGLSKTNQTVRFVINGHVIEALMEDVNNLNQAY